jgi:hypothetical protein
LLSKKNGKKGPAAKRLIHLLDPLGKAYFKQLWRRKPPRTWHFEAGFTKHSRREQGLVQARVVQYKITKRGRGFISSSYDVANAFPSISHSELDRVIEDKYGAEPGPNAELLKTKYRQAYTHIRTEDGGEILGALGTGGMQGDCVMPGQFVEGYSEGIESWARDTEQRGRKSLVAREPLSGQSIDTSLSVFADDLWRTGVAENLHEAQSLVEDWDTKLDKVLSTKSMGQNHAKKEHMVRFVGKGAAVEMRKAYQEKLSTFETVALLSGGVLPWANESMCPNTDKQYIKYLLGQAQPKTLTPKQWAALTAKVEALGNNTIAQFLFANGWYQDGISVNNYQYIESETAAVRVPTGDRTFVDVGVCPIEFIQRVAKAFGVGTDEMVEMISAKALVAA